MLALKLADRAVTAIPVPLYSIGSAQEVLEKKQPQWRQYLANLSAAPAPKGRGRFHIKDPRRETAIPPKCKTELRGRTHEPTAIYPSPNRKAAHGGQGRSTMPMYAASVAESGGLWGEGKRIDWDAGPIPRVRNTTSSARATSRSSVLKERHPKRGRPTAFDRHPRPRGADQNAIIWDTR